jgi:hypothetical protein
MERHQAGWPASLRRGRNKALPTDPVMNTIGAGSAPCSPAAFVHARGGRADQFADHAGPMLALHRLHWKATAVPPGAVAVMSPP